MTSLWAERVLLAGGFTPAAVVLGTDGSIAAVQERDAPAPGDTPLGEGVLSAGMVDLQLNGCAGVDLAAADADAWGRVAAHQAAHGVTAFCPTFITAPLERLLTLADEAAHAASLLAGCPVAQPLGAHLEGPFLAPQRAGAHPPDAMREPTPGAIDAVLEARERIALVTLAPELPGARDAIARLAHAGIRVSLGHTDATAARVADAAAAGATLVTHLFNAQRPLHHREPGVPGRALVDPRLVCGLIADLHHVAPDVIRVAFAAAGAEERIALVSDAVAAAGMAPGEFRHGPLVAYAHADGPPRLADGTLAGSALHLDEAVRNVLGLGVPAETALRAATAVPARALGDTTRGEIAAGRRADLVWWDDDFQVRTTWVGGAEAAP